jgi:hypothetical protein
VTLVLIVLLVLLWGAVIVPTILRVRQSPASSVGAFRKNMQALGARSATRPLRRPSGGGAGTAGRWILGPPPRQSSARYRSSAPSRTQPPPAARHRPRGSRSSGSWLVARDDFDSGGLTMDQRRAIFFTLLTAAAFTLLLGLAFGLLLRIHLGVDVALLGYVVYLVRTKPRTMEPREVATYYPGAARGSVDGRRGRDSEREWLRAGEL